jgi:hypothetical protein
MKTANRIFGLLVPALVASALAMIASFSLTGPLSNIPFALFQCALTCTFLGLFSVGGYYFTEAH